MQAAVRVRYDRLHDEWRGLTPDQRILDRRGVRRQLDGLRDWLVGHGAYGPQATAAAAQDLEGDREERERAAIIEREGTVDIEEDAA